MKAEQLKQIIDKLVERKLNSEVKRIIREAVTEEVNKAMGRVLVEMVKEVKKTPTENNTITESVAPPTVRQREIKALKTNNPKLDSALADTVRNYRPLQKTMDAVGSLAELMEGSFDKVGEEVSYQSQQEPAPVDNSKVGYLKQLVGESVSPQQRSVLDSPAVPDVLKGVFKRDYRAVMKSIDEKKKHGMFSSAASLG